MLRQFPNRVPSIDVGSADFECGYTARTDAALRNADETNADRCYLCLGFPKSAVANSVCRHIMCDSCATEQLVKAEANDMSLTCGMCRSVIKINEFIVQEQFIPWMKAKIQEGEYECWVCESYTGSKKEVDEHQIYSCPLRVIRCPNSECDVVQPAYMLEAHHYNHCANYRQYCVSCRLPIAASQLESHKCIAELQSTILSMILCCFNLLFNRYYPWYYNKLDAYFHYFIVL